MKKHDPIYGQNDQLKQWWVLVHSSPIMKYYNQAKVNQQPPMHQLVVLSTRWATFFHLALDGVHHNPFFLVIDHYTLIYFIFLFCGRFSLGPNLTPSYPTHFPTLINTTPTLVPYLLSPTDITTLITTLITSYHVDLATILTTYPTNLTTLLITYPTNLTIVLTTYLIDLTTLCTQPPY